MSQLGLKREHQSWAEASESLFVFGAVFLSAFSGRTEIGRSP